MSSRKHSTCVLLAAAALLALPALGTAAPQQTNNCRRSAKKLEALERRVLEPRGPVRPARVRKLARLTRKVQDRCVRLNQVQVLGSHNSYHIQPEPALFAVLLAFSPVFEQIEYTHIPLDQQFATQGIRQIEIDVFADPDGGLFERRGGLQAIGQEPHTGIPALLAPGLKVIHLQDIDFGTTCLTFVECLQTVKTWSDANPDHLPLTILVELKDEALPELGFGFAVPLPFDAAAMDTLDAEIRSVFPEERLITPDSIRGKAATLEEAVLTKGWPTLAESRGRVLFAMDNAGAKRDVYRDGRPNLEGRVLFTNGEPGDPDAAFVKRNDPFDAAIPGLVRDGYIVRTRADGDTVEARSGDTGPRDAALASGAQYVSTDYPVPDPDFGTGYFVEIPDGNPARCNPINGPAGCRSASLETPAP